MALKDLLGHARKRFWLLFRYGVSGTIGASTQTFILYLWISVLGFHDTYLLGSFVGFCIALALTFALQKFWTFRDRTLDRAHHQAFWYTLVAICSVGIGVGLLALAKEYFAAIGVDFFAGWYLIVQIFIVMFTSALSFLFNYFITFKGTHHQGSGAVLPPIISVVPTKRIHVRIAGWLATSEIPYLLLLAALCLLIFAPYLFGGMMYAGDEQLGGFYQYSLFYSHALASGQSFLFDPHSYGGNLSYLSQFGAYLFPPVYFIFKLFSPFFAYYVVITLAIFTGLAFTYLLGRSLTLSRPASFIMALVYCTAQSPGIFQSGLSFAHSFLVLPLLLYCLVKIKRAEKMSSLVAYVALGSIGIGVGFLASNFVIFLYGLVFAGLFAVFLDLFGTRLGYKDNYRAVLALLLMGIVGTCIGAPQLIALYAYGPSTSRTAGYATESASSHVAFVDFIRLFLPYNFSFPLPGSSGVAFLYYGFVPLIFGVFALTFVGESTLATFFVSVFVLFVALSMNLPGFEWFNTHAPVFDRIGGMVKWLLAAAIAPAYLAGYGFDRFVGLAHTPKTLRFWGIGRALSLSGVGLLLVLQIPLNYFASSPVAAQWIFTKALAISGRSLASLKYPLTFYTDTIHQQLSSIRDTFSFANPHLDIFIALTLLGVWAIQYLVRTGPMRRNKSFVVLIVAVAFVALFAADTAMYAVSRGTYFTLPPPVAQALLNREPDSHAYRFVTFEGEQLGRDVYAAGTRFTPAVTAQTMRELLLLDEGSAFGLETVGGHDPLRSMRQNQLIYTALEQHADLVIDPDLIAGGAPIDHYVNSALVTKVTPEEKARDIEKRIPLLSMMNVKYIISLYPLTDLRVQKIASFSIPDLNLEYSLYENKTVLPRLYFAEHPTVWQGSERDLFVAMLETTDFSQKTYLECSNCEETPSGSGTVKVTHTENGVVEATTSSTTGGWLVLSDANLPGWVATVDGVRVPIATANYLFQAIAVPKGTHTVTFKFIGSFALFLEKLGLEKP